jgi:Mn-dependent DtxR family transcriptional regulator
MAQYDVNDFLKNNKDEWFTSKDISKALNINRRSVTISLQRLRKHGYISYKQFNNIGYLYKYSKDKVCNY